MKMQQMGKMMSGIAEMQKKMDVIQKELSEAVYDGDAANGLVKVQVTGKGEIKNLVLNPGLFTEDAETVADLIVVAHRKAFDAKEKHAKEKLGSIASGILPLGIKLPGLG